MYIYLSPHLQELFSEVLHVHASATRAEQKGKRKKKSSLFRVQWCHYMWKTIICSISPITLWQCSPEGCGDSTNLLEASQSLPAQAGLHGKGCLGWQVVLSDTAYLLLVLIITVHQLIDSTNTDKWSEFGLQNCFCSNLHMLNLSWISLRFYFTSHPAVTMCRLLGCWSSFWNITDE